MFALIHLFWCREVATAAQQAREPTIYIYISHLIQNVVIVNVIDVNDVINIINVVNVLTALTLRKEPIVVIYILH